MKKCFYYLLFVFSSAFSAHAFSEVSPYLGASLHLFSIKSEDIKASTGNQSFEDSDGSSDSGTTAGLDLGLAINDNGRIQLSHYSGEENDSEILEATVTSITYNYSTNSAGPQRGWYVGAGISRVEIQSDRNEITEAGSADDTGIIFRAGYQYLADSGLMLETGLNYNTAEAELQLSGTGQFSAIEIEATSQVASLHFGLSYVF